MEFSSGVVMFITGLIVSFVVLPWILIAGAPIWTPVVSAAFLIYTRASRSWWGVKIILLKGLGKDLKLRKLVIRKFVEVFSEPQDTGGRPLVCACFECHGGRCFVTMRATGCRGHYFRRFSGKNHAAVAEKMMSELDELVVESSWWTPELRLSPLCNPKTCPIKSGSIFEQAQNGFIQLVGQYQ